MDASNRRVGEALGSIPSKWKESIERHLYPEWLEGKNPHERMEVVRAREMKEVLEAAASVDRNSMIEAALTLLDAIRSATEILSVPEMKREIQSFSFETPLGLVEVGGRGPDVHSRDAVLIVDLGGDDLYQGKTASGRDGRCAIVLDLEGNDLYTGGDFTQGSGFWSIGILCDLKGNDLYQARNCAQGAALFGVGILIDQEGNDHYVGGHLVQAASAWGLGGLLDLSGEDVYQCESSGQAYSGVLGISCLCDRGGNDRYLSGMNRPDPREPDMSQSFSQGFSMGMRNLAPGGFSLLADGGGNDLYHCHYFGQGSSYWMGVGLLYDHSGKDSYSARRYAQGAGIHYSLGMLMDAGGDDHTSSWGVSQGCGHDYGIGILVNHAGNDTYVSDWLSTGASEANGVGIFVDTSGDDGYEVRSGLGQGHLTLPRRAGGIGLFVDAAGKDRYSTRGADNTVWIANRWGVGIDENEGRLSGLDLSAEIAPLDVRGTTGGKRSGGKGRLKGMVEGSKHLPSQERLENLLAAATHWGLEEEVTREAQEELLEMDPELSLPFLMGFLDTPDVMTLLFLEKFVSVHPYHAVPHLIGKAAGDLDPSTRAVALSLLSKIKDPLSIGCATAALRDPDWRVRSGGVRLLGETLDQDRVKSLVLLREALDRAEESADPWPLKEHADEKNLPLTLSVLAGSRPLDYAKYRSLDTKSSNPDLVAALFQHRRDLLDLLETWMEKIEGSRDAVPEIRRCLDDPDPAVRKGAAYALGQLRDRVSMERLLTLFSDPDPWVRDAAVLSLSLYGDECIPLLEQAIGTGEPALILLSLDVLGRIPSEPARTLLRSLLHHPDENVKRMARIALGRN